MDPRAASTTLARCDQLEEKVIQPKSDSNKSILDTHLQVDPPTSNTVAFSLMAAGAVHGVRILSRSEKCLLITLGIVERPMLCLEAIVIE